MGGRLIPSTITQILNGKNAHFAHPRRDRVEAKGAENKRKIRSKISRSPLTKDFRGAGPALGRGRRPNPPGGGGGFGKCPGMGEVPMHDDGGRPLAGHPARSGASGGRSRSGMDVGGSNPRARAPVLKRVYSCAARSSEMHCCGESRQCLQRISQGAFNRFDVSHGSARRSKAIAMIRLGRGTATTCGSSD
jgi:hypothetical protein